MTLLSGTGSVFGRDVRAKLRTPWPYAESIADPIALLILFGALLAGLGDMPGMPAGDSIQWFVPGILVLMAFATSAFIGSGLQEERQSGSLERMLVTPVSRSALLLGRALRVVLTVAVQSLIVIAVTAAFGFTAPVAAIPVAVVQLMALAAALSIGSLAVGLALKDAYAFWGVVALVYTPIIVTSGVLLPLEIGPDWLFAVSRLNPLAHAVDAQRALFAGDVLTPEVGIAFAVIVALGAVATALGVRSLGRMRS